jgi:hypothetical protein
MSVSIHYSSRPTIIRKIENNRHEYAGSEIHN